MRSILLLCVLLLPVPVLAEAPQLGLTARATVDRVIDGDTIVVTFHWPVTIRLRDCWAPEVHGAESEQGLEAKDFVRSLAPVGTDVIVHAGTPDANNLGDLMSFGRVVGDVWIGGRNLSEAIVRAGHATAEKVRK